MNKKIINATQIVVDNVKYRSKLESKCAKILKDNNIPFEYEPFKIQYIKKFEYKNEKYRAAYYTPDFVIEDKYILEIKGFPNDVWRYKKKLILLKLKENMNNKYIFYEIKNEKQLKNWIENYKNNIYERN